MAIYRVTWEIDIDAKPAKAAAVEALRIHRDPESIATVFHVARHVRRTGRPVRNGVVLHDIGLFDLTPGV